MKNPEGVVAFYDAEQAAAVADLLNAAQEVGEAAAEPVEMRFPDEVVEWFGLFVDTNIGTVQLEPGYQHMLHDRHNPEPEVRRYTLEEVSFRMPVAHSVIDLINGEHSDDTMEAMVQFQAIYPVAGRDESHEGLYAHKIGRITTRSEGHIYGASMLTYQRRLAQIEAGAGKDEPDLGDKIAESFARLFRPKKYARELQAHRDRMRQEDRDWAQVEVDDLEIVTAMLRIAGRV